MVKRKNSKRKNTKNPDVYFTTKPEGVKKSTKLTPEKKLLRRLNRMTEEQRGELMVKQAHKEERKRVAAGFEPTPVIRATTKKQNQKQRGAAARCHKRLLQDNGKSYYEQKKGRSLR